MNKKEQLIYFLKRKTRGDINMTYEEIANATGYHPKYIIRFNKNLKNGKITLEHGNKNRKPARTITPSEEEKIINLYKRSNASIRKFSQFYGQRSYSCIYNVLKKNNLI